MSLAIAYFCGLIGGMLCGLFIAGLAPRHTTVNKRLRARIRMLNACLKVERANAICHFKRAQDLAHRLELIDLDYREAA